MSSPRLVPLLMLIIFVSSPACSDDSDDSSPPPPSEALWAPTTVPYDPECKSGCETIDKGSFGHFGELEIAVNPNVDDSIAQWADCLESFQTCLFKGEDGLACSQQSSCPAKCREQYEERLRSESISDPRAQHDAFREVYVAEGAPCLPTLEEAN